MTKFLAIAGILGALAVSEAAPEIRALPKPLPSHPGNIFLTGEPVILSVPGATEEKWRVTDYEKKTVKEGSGEIGPLPVGYYELHLGTNVVFFGVLEPLHAPTPLTSPIGIDVALAWFAPTREEMEKTASLCQLAGMNRVRDRIYWGELEPKRGEITASNRYDASLEIQAAAGMQVLNVNHASAAWANPNGKRFPPDLRDIHNFYRAMAKRWQGKLEAFEPWNEADIDMFGGHTGNEMASLQKAAYWGLKEGNPKLTICQNVFALPRVSTLRNFNDNHAWPYFDTFNLHHYEQFSEYPRVHRDYLSVSAGRPWWSTECNVTVDWSGDENLREPSPEDLLIQSERVARVYAEDIYYGAQAVFYFMLPHYVEGTKQYGVLHKDLSPRPAYLAIAAAGRLLADAKAVGRLKDADGVLMTAKPDGKEADVLVAWSETEKEIKLPKPPQACFDHLGRTMQVNGNTLRVGRAPIYVILSENGRPEFTPPPKPTEWFLGKPSKIVLQALPPEKDIIIKKSAYHRATNVVSETPVFIYNFGTKPAKGKMVVTAPDHWTSEFPADVEIGPGERKELILKLKDAGEWPMARVQIKGDFGADGKTFLALRFAPE